jgi:outer membrane protein OmpA-like peptidoglycan-associated protein
MVDNVLWYALRFKPAKHILMETNTFLNQKIFIVEDDPWYGEILQYHLSLNPDFEVERFESGSVFLKNLHRKPDLISIDYSLDDMNGQQLLSKIRQWNNEVPVIVISGQEEGERFSFEAMDEGDLASLQVLHQEVAGQGKMLYRRESMDGEYIKGGEADEDAMRGFELVDGTPDSKDKPRDPKEALYNVSFEKETIFFEHNKYSIDQNQDGSKGSVIAKKLKANPAMRIEIQGYASQPGTEAYNLLLSQRRADELKRLLVEKYGIDPGRIVPVGKGEDPAVTEQEARRARIIILE